MLWFILSTPLFTGDSTSATMVSRWLLVLFRYILDSLAYLIGLFSPAQRERLPPIRDSILLKSAHEISSLIRSRKVSCVQVITAHIDRIKECEPLVNALVDDRFADALEEANSIDRALDNGEQVVGSLLGVPFTGKDSHSVKGLSWTAGILAMKGVKGKQDAPVVKNLKAAGAICLGVTNVPELTLWWDTSNKLYGTTNNPYDLSRIPGGSTGANAALISYAGSPFGNATDMGGSIRMPSAFCGVYGHKPTPGVVPTEGHYPPMGHYRDQYLSVGPICRYVCDIQPVLTAMAGGDSVITEKLPHLNRPVDWSRVNIYYQLDSGDPSCTRSKSYVRESIIRAAQHFESKYNSNVKQVIIPELAEAFHMFMENYKDASVPSIASALTNNQGEINVLKQLALSLIGKSNVTLASIFICLLEKMSPRAPSAHWVSRYEKFKDKFISLLGHRDHDAESIFLYPVHPEVAPKHATTVLKINNAVAHCSIFNLLQTPVTVCPVGLNDQGLPMSVQIIAAPFKDYLTIAAANELDTVFGGWKCPSSINVHQ